MSTELPAAIFCAHCKLRYPWRGDYRTVPCPKCGGPLHTQAELAAGGADEAYSDRAAPKRSQPAPRPVARPTISANLADDRSGSGGDGRPAATPSSSRPTPDPARRGIRVEQRASFALQATTKLSPEEALRVVTEATGAVKGGGMSLLTTGVSNLAAEVHVKREGKHSLGMSVTSGRELVELCTFSAKVEVAGEQTVLTVGGLDTYKTQQKTYMLIPTGPKEVYGMAPYKQFLKVVQAHLASADPSARIVLGQTAQ